MYQENIGLSKAQASTDFWLLLMTSSSEAVAGFFKFMLLLRPDGPNLLTNLGTNLQLSQP